MFKPLINRLLIFLIAVLVLLAIILIVTPKPAYAQAIGDYTDLQGNAHHGQGVAPMTGALFVPGAPASNFSMGFLSAGGGNVTNSENAHRIPSTVITAVVKASLGRFYGWTLTNTAVSVRYVHIYNKTTVPVLGTDTPIFTIPIPAATTISIDMTVGVGAASGLSWAATTDDIVIPTTAAAAGEVVGTLWFN